jgi:hypothetical protein
MPTKDELAAELNAARLHIEELDGTVPVEGAGARAAQAAPPTWLHDILQQQVQAFKDLVQAIAPGRAAAGQQRTNIPKPSPPSKLECGMSHAMFKVWQESWDDFARLSDVAREPGEKQVAILKGCMGLKMRMDLQYAIGVTDADTPVEILDKVDRYLRSKQS